MSDSIHTARWINQITDSGWDIHLFPSIDRGQVHPQINGLYVYHSVYGKKHPSKSKITCRGLKVFSETLARFIRSLLERYFGRYRILQLRRAIHKLRPDIVHCIEIQHAGYLALYALKEIRKANCKLVVTNWGSDIYLYGRIEEHRDRIKQILQASDFYSCECERDVDLARQHGLRGEVLPVMPNTGGYDLKEIIKLRSAGNISERKQIMLKGYQGWSGRALSGLRALERCADMLSGYTLVIYSASEDVILAGELFSDATGVAVKVLPANTEHTEILRHHGQARISIGVGISDAISTSMLEAMVMGSFPVQSYTSCADEWITDGVTGFLVPPEDPEVIENTIRKILTDDQLVDNAAIANWKLAQESLSSEFLKNECRKMYEHVMSH